MAAIKFASNEAFELYRAMEEETCCLQNPLSRVVARFLTWYDWDDEITIGIDPFSPKSFGFGERHPDGTRGICGGIIRTEHGYEVHT